MGPILCYLLRDAVPPSGPAAVPTPLTRVCLLVFLTLCVLAPFACTILGILSIRRIRRSGGALIGLPLAVAVALFYPLAILDGLISIVPIYLLRGQPPEDSIVQAAFVLLAVAVVDFLIVWAVWRAVRKPVRAGHG